MINKITAKEYPSVFKNYRYLLELEITKSYVDHRRGSNFYAKSIIKIKKEYLDYLLPKVKDNEFLIGLWETNEYIYDTEYGIAIGPSELTRVKEVTEIIQITKYIPIV